MAATAHSPRVADSAEVDALSLALAAAFERDPVLGWLVPEARRRHRLTRFFRLELRHVVLPAGTVWTVEGCVGASLELPPGHWRMSLGTQLAHGPLFLRVFGPR